MRKWSSNSNEFLQAINTSSRNTEHCFDLNLDKETRALGVFWCQTTDTLPYKINVTPLSHTITKRQQLSDVARIYDLTCLLAPMVVTGKIICQQLWLTGCNWDDAIPEPHQTNWCRFRNELKIIECIKIPRWILHTAEAQLQLHIFCDASISAYAAAAYMRVTRQHMCP